MYKRCLFGGALALTLASFAGCAKDSEVVIDLGGDSGTAPPSLVDTTSDASAEASIDAGAEMQMCIATECPAPWATCPSWSGTIPQKCSTNLLTDGANCGACGDECPFEYSGLNMGTRCVNGACQRECKDANARDCNGLVDDGCEVDVTNDPDNCGTCGTKCGAGERCHKGKCGCPTGQIDCGESEGCIDVSRNDWNCGTCGHLCTVPDDAPEPPDHMTYGCGNSECGKLRCSDGWKEAWADCNDDIETDGCEINTATDPKNCGTCGHACAPGQFCLSDGLNPPKCACDPGQAMCGDAENPWCADLQNDKVNCGTCGHQCPGGRANGSPVCTKGFCDYVCDQGFGDCDGNPDNGCETDLRTSGANCGACGARCDTSAGQPCIDGKCLTVECDGGPVK